MDYTKPFIWGYGKGNRNGGILEAAVFAMRGDLQRQHCSSTRVVVGHIGTVEIPLGRFLLRHPFLFPGRSYGHR